MLENKIRKESQSKNLVRVKQITFKIIRIKFDIKIKSNQILMDKTEK
jgi:hypothetical protein